MKEVNGVCGQPWRSKIQVVPEGEEIRFCQLEPDHHNHLGNFSQKKIGGENEAKDCCDGRVLPHLLYILCVAGKFVDVPGGTSRNVSFVSLSQTQPC